MKMGTAGGSRGEGREVGWWGGGVDARARGRMRIEFSSFQSRMVSLRSERPICAPPRLSDVSQHCLASSVWDEGAV